MRHPGEVLSKSGILDHVWDFTFDGDPNIVEVYVRQLRLRIDEPFDRSALQTVRGVGYRLTPTVAERPAMRSVRARITLLTTRDLQRRAGGRLGPPARHARPLAAPDSRRLARSRVLDLAVLARQARSRRRSARR